GRGWARRGGRRTRSARGSGRGNMATTRILIPQADIQHRIGTLAAEIEKDYPASEEIHLVAVLKGGFMFMSDLVRAMSDRVTMDFMAVWNYGWGNTTATQGRVLKAFDQDLEGRHCLLLRANGDSGRQLLLPKW